LLQMQQIFPPGLGAGFIGRDDVTLIRRICGRHRCRNGRIVTSTRAMLAADFIARWRAVDLTERVAAQSHFHDLCHLLDEEAPADAGPTVSHAHETVLNELGDMRKLRWLKSAFTGPEQLKPGLRQQPLTEQARPATSRGSQKRLPKLRFRTEALLAAYWRRCAAAVLLLASAHCAQLPPTGSVVVPPIPAGEARIWIYRNDGPTDSQNRPYLRLNGEVAAISEPNGAFFRDLPPGRYTVSVDSYGAPFSNQFAVVDLDAGQTAFVQVLSMRERAGGDNVGTRALFFTRLVPADIAQPAIAATLFYSTS
jgi:hypothetical protein